jgi:hypothetical protein
MAKKKPVVPRKGAQQMSERRMPQNPNLETKTFEIELSDSHRQPAQTHREKEDEDEFGVTRLSADQHRTARALNRLYRSLCGGQPGQYWPQALLDSAGRFNRPLFPGPDHRKQ